MSVLQLLRVNLTLSLLSWRMLGTFQKAGLVLNYHLAQRPRLQIVICFQAVQPNTLGVSMQTLTLQ